MIDTPPSTSVSELARAHRRRASQPWTTAFLAGAVSGLVAWFVAGTVLLGASWLDSAGEWVTSGIIFGGMFGTLLQIRLTIRPHVRELVQRKPITALQFILAMACVGAGLCVAFITFCTFTMNTYYGGILVASPIVIAALTGFIAFKLSN